MDKNIDWPELLRRAEYEDLTAAELIDVIDMKNIFYEEYWEYEAEYSDGNIDYGV